jgi:hypothetical protein
MLVDTLVLLCLLLLPAQGIFAMGERRVTDGEIAPARPGIAAEQEEFEAAQRKGTEAAFEFFLKRHPNGPFAEVAKEALERLRSYKPPRER